MFHKDMVKEKFKAYSFCECKTNTLGINEKTKNV